MMWCSRCRLARSGIDIACQECGTLLTVAPIAIALADAEELIRELADALKDMRNIHHLGWQATNPYRQALIYRVEAAIALAEARK